MTYQRIKFISVPIYYQNGEFYFYAPGHVKCMRKARILPRRGKQRRTEDMRGHENSDLR